MKNRERFKDEIARIATSGDRLACQDGTPVGCTDITCTTCDFKGNECWLKLREWADKEYVPFDIDWPMVPVDTPVVIHTADDHWEDNRGFSVECIRDDEDSNVYDQDGKLIDDRRGTPIVFRVYYQINHYDEDCCALTSGLNLKDMEELAAFVNMYNW